MKIVRIGRTVDLGLGEQEFNREDELAYALATSIMPQLLEYQSQKARNKNQIDETNDSIESNERDGNDKGQKLDVAREKISELEAEASDLEVELEMLDDRPWNWFRWLWMLFNGKKWREERDAVVLASKEVEDKLDPLKENSHRLVSELSECTDWDKKLHIKMESLMQDSRELETVPRVVDGIRAFDYPMMPITMVRDKFDGDEVTGSVSISFYIDPNGDAISLELPQIDLSEDELEYFINVLNDLDTERVLLDPGGDKTTFGEKDKLFGTEKAIKEISKVLQEFLENYNPARFDIPVIKKGSAAGICLENALDSAELSEPEDAILVGSTSRKLQELHQVRNKIQELLRKNTLLDKFDQWFVDLEPQFIKPHELLEIGRQASLGTNRKNLDKAFFNSRLTRYHFFCPKCNGNTAYLKQFHNFSEDDVDRMDTSKIAESLKDYQTTFFNDRQGKRYDPKDIVTIANSWDRAYRLLEDIQEKCVDIFLRIRATNASNSEERSSKEFQERQLKSLKATYSSIIDALIKHPLDVWREESVEQPDDDASAIPNTPIEILNPNTRLTYDPECNQDDRDPWSCPLCETQFSKETAMLHAADKFRNDLVYPMLHTLWNDEAIWGKKVDLMKDVGREIRDRRVEESNSLQAPIDNFLADSRQVRLNLQEAYAKGEATLQRLEQISKEFVAADLLETDDLQRVMDSVRSSNEMIEKVDSEIKDIDKLERDLQKVPGDVFKDRLLPLAPERKAIESDARRFLLPFVTPPEVDQEDENTKTEEDNFLLDLDTEVEEDD